MKSLFLRSTFLLFAAIFLLTSVFQQTVAQINTRTLINEMADLKRLAEFPSPGFTTIQLSSYDKQSTSPSDPGWFANGDGGFGPMSAFEKVIREPDENGIGEYLMFDVKGPGAIVRLWTATITGNIRLYLDGKTDPVYNGSAFDFFTRTYNAMAPGMKADLDGSFTQYLAGYYPIPFATQCKIVWEGNVQLIHFYHINIRLYEQGTNVITFKPEDIKTYLKEIENTKKIFSDPDKSLLLSNAETLSLAVNVEPGKEQEILNIRGNKGISYLEMKILSNDIKTALRQTVLRISFDDASDPQIQSPVGDFFGTAAGINPYQSLPFTVLKDGTLICRFFMPFKKSASIRIENIGEKNIALVGKVKTETYQWNEERSMYFRARWRVNHDLAAKRGNPYDINFLHTTGKGVCVGTAIHLLNPSENPSNSNNWWGEGDEKIVVDDNPFPVFFGTGSEDYFNYAWCSPDIFSHAYCGQPRNDGPASRGFVTNFRWHILDNIPFRQNFAFYMELLTNDIIEGFSYARIIYHYGFKDMYDDNNRISIGDVRILTLPEIWYPNMTISDPNSLFYEAEDIVIKNDNICSVPGRLWLNGQLLEWNPETAGDNLNFILPIVDDGNYIVHIIARLDNNSGSFNLNINDSKINITNTTLDDLKKSGSVYSLVNDIQNRNIKTINLNTSHGILSRTFSLNALELKRGGHKLTMESLQPNKPIGIDYFWIQKTK